MIARWGAPLAVLALAALAGVSNAADPREPPPLGGAPLAGPTGLRLLVPTVPPVLFDVDTSRTTIIRGIVAQRGSVAWAVAVGADAVVAVDRPGGPPPVIYSLRRGTTRARRIGTGKVVAPAGGQAIWVKSHVDARHCILRRIRLDGGLSRAARRMSCSAHLVAAGGRTVIVEGQTIRDPLTGRTLLRAPSVWAIAGRYALGEAFPHRPLPVTDMRTGEQRLLPWPSTSDLPDEAVVHPDGRRIAVGFADFVPRAGRSQVTDVWLLDTADGKFQHLPDMPAAVALKRSSMAWTSDGRLVWLADAPDPVVAVWRPGEERIRVRRIPLPVRNGGSDSFVVWAR